MPAGYTTRPSKERQRRPINDNRKFATIAEFSGGLDDTSDAISVPAGYSRVVRNVHWRRRYLEKRAGSIQLGQTLAAGAIQWVGLYWNKESASRKYMCIAGDKLLRLDTADLSASATGTWKGAVSGTTGGAAGDVCCSGTALCAVQQYANRLWITDGVTAKRYTEDPAPAIQAWSFASVAAMPAPVCAAAVAGGTLTNPGTYNCKVTYRDPLTGDETNGSPVSNNIATSGASQKIPVSYGPDPNWTSNYSEVKVYRCKADSTAGLWYFEKTIAAVVGLNAAPITFDLTVADSALGDNSVPTNHGAVVPAKYILLFDDTFVLWGFPTELSRVRYSLAGEPWSWPTTNFLEVNLKDGQALQSCQVGYHQVIAFKDRSTHILSRDETFSFVREEIPQSWGIASGRGVATVDQLIYGRDVKGPFTFSANHFEPIGARVQVELEKGRVAAKLHLGHAVGAKTNFGNWWLLWEVNDAALTQPNRTLVFDSRSNGWALWDGLAARVSAAVPLPSGKELVWIGTESGKVVALEEDLAGARQWQDYDGSAVAAEYLLGPFGLEPDETGNVPHKVFQWLELTLPRHTAGKVAAITVQFYTEQDDLSGAGFASKTYTPHTAGDELKVFKVPIDVAKPAQALWARIVATSANQEMLISRAAAAHAPWGKKLA